MSSEFSEKDLSPLRLGIFGTGRVAIALLKGFRKAGIEVAQLIGRDPEKRRALGNEYGVNKVAPPDEADPELELLLLPVSDDAIGEAVDRLPPMKGVLAHCSGALPMGSLQGKGSGQGVLYPVQSFSTEGEPDWDEIPICIEATDPKAKELLHRTASSLSGSVHELGHEARKQLHLAAVLACNFSNELYRSAHQLLGENGIPFGILRSLIIHTAERALEGDPKEMQTGPAVRKDLGTIEEHMELLKEDPELQELYRGLTRRIMKVHHGKSEL